MVSYLVSIVLLAVVGAERRAHHWVNFYEPEVLAMISKHKAGVQSISLNCKCYASNWEQKTKNNPSATWCGHLDDCRDFIPKLKNLGIKVLLSMTLGKNKFAAPFLKDAEAFSETLKSMVADLNTDGFSFDLESGGTDKLGDDYASFLKTVSGKLGSGQELMIAGGHHTVMTHDIATLSAHADWFSMNSYIFDGMSKWQALVSGEYSKAKSGGHADRYIPGVLVGTESVNTHWDEDKLRSALDALDDLGISRVGVFGLAKPAADLPANKTFFWDVIESWVTGAGTVELV